jgi:hypothetical protein
MPITVEDLSGVTNILYSDLLTLYNAGTMTAGTFYNITDRPIENVGLILQATSPTELALNGTVVFLNPDFQSVGVYTGVVGLTGVAYTSTQGVWNLTDEAGYTDGMVCFYDGFHYQVTDNTLFDGLPPDNGINGYTLLAKTDADVGYIVEADYVEYDLVTDFFLRRRDKRGNDVIGNSIFDFQWGRDVVENNTIEGLLFCENSLCTSISNNHIGCGMNVNINAGVAASWDRNKFYNGATYNVTDIDVSFTGTIGEFNGNTLTPTENIIFDSAISVFGSYEGEVLSKLGSTFEIIVEDTGLTAIDLGTAKTYAGIVNIQQVAAGTSAITIVDLLNFPIDRPVLVRPRSYSFGIGDLTATFTHGTGTDDPHCSGGVDAVLLGDNGDFIQFTRRETKVSSGVYRIYQTGGETY